MLPADHRLRDSDGFRRTVRTGRRAGSSALVAHVARPQVGADGRGGAAAGAGDAVRVGFVVSKAVGNAVTRNLVKRRLRHFVKVHLANLPPGSTLVVRALPAAAHLPSAELAAELDRCLQRAQSAAAAAAVRTGAAS